MPSVKAGVREGLFVLYFNCLCHSILPLSLSPFLQFTIEELILAPRFAQYLSKWEYFTRLGWLDNGKKSVHYLSLSLFQTNINIHTHLTLPSLTLHTHTHTYTGTSLNLHSLLSLFPLSIFVQVLDREQHESQLILIPIESFHKEGEKGATCYTFLLWKETSQYWINVRRVSLLFLDCPSLPLFTDLIP